MAERIEIQYATDDGDPPAAENLQHWAAAAMTAAGYARAALTVRVIGEAEGRELNQRYRGRDYATNVLSFPFDEVAPEAMQEMGRLYLGDIAICAPVIRREAEEQGKAGDAHWAHMVIHGILHLAGQHHEDDEAAERMERHERGILVGLGFPDPCDADSAA